MTSWVCKLDWRNRLSGVLFAALLTACLPLLSAPPPAGAIISNTATASYVDGGSTTQNIASNTLTTVVQQVASFTLIADRSQNVTPGGNVIFQHTLTNTGNGSDSFNFSLTNNPGSFNFSSIQIFADADANGIPDNATAITSSGALTAGASFSFVVVAGAPAAALDGQSDSLTLSASSVFGGFPNQSVTDTATVSGNAILNFAKVINPASGCARTGPYTYTINYNNSGSKTATAIAISDLIPSGMSYVPGSARWSVTGANVLTDSNNADAQGIAPNTIVYDFSVTQLNRATFVINQIAAGQSGSVTFQVSVNAGVPPQSIANSANFTYDDGNGSVQSGATAAANFTVNACASVDVTSDVSISGGATPANGLGAGPEASPTLTLSVNPGAAAVVPLYVNNTSLVSDSFDLSASADSSFASIVLPAGWSVVFREDGGGATPCAATSFAISNTGSIPGSAPVASKLVCAVVQVAPGFAPGSVDLFFRALSSAFSTADVIRDRVTVSSVRNLTFTPNNSGQTSANNSIVYPHSLLNLGNTSETVSFLGAFVADSLGASGWFSSAFRDNPVAGGGSIVGALDPTDTPIALGATLVLSPGAAETLLLRVTAPAVVLAGAQNVSTFTVSVAGGGTLAVADTTTIAAGQISILKEQALDINCDGDISDLNVRPTGVTYGPTYNETGAFTSTALSVGAAKGACVRYRVTATNAGTSNLRNIVITDATRPGTVYHDGTASCVGITGTAPAAAALVNAVALASTNITVPSACGAGVISARINGLAPAGVVVFEFGVRIQ